MAQDVRVATTRFRKGVGQFWLPHESTTTTKYTKDTKKTAFSFVFFVLFVVLASVEIANILPSPGALFKRSCELPNGMFRAEHSVGSWQLSSDR